MAGFAQERQERKEEFKSSLKSVYPVLVLYNSRHALDVPNLRACCIHSCAPRSVAVYRYCRRACMNVLVSGQRTPMLLRLRGAATYSVDSRAGNFRLYPDCRIVFETGPPASGFHSMLLSEGRIGLNTDGGKFYPISCELNRNLR